MEMGMAQELTGCADNELEAIRAGRTFGLLTMTQDSPGSSSTFRSIGDSLLIACFVGFPQEGFCVSVLPVIAAELDVHWHF
jgi:hypothetical protein